MLINRRNGLVAGKALPYKKRLEYIESDGGQYIDTGIVPSMNTDMEIKCRYTANNHINTLAGGGVSWLNNEILIAANLVSPSNRIIFVRGSSRTNLYVGTAPSLIDTDLVAGISGSLAYANNESDTFSASTMATQNSIYLFSTHRNSLSVDENFIGRMYYATISSSGVRVRSFIPVLDNNDVACMYDEVSGELFYNAGTGTFTAGPEV